MSHRTFIVKIEHLPNNFDEDSLFRILTKSGLGEDSINIMEV